MENWKWICANHLPLHGSIIAPFATMCITTLIPMHRSLVRDLWCCYRCVQMLCAVNADVNVRDLVGRTSMWTAVSQDGRLSSVKRLIDAGCNVNIPDKRDKRTPLQVSNVYKQGIRTFRPSCKSRHRT